MMEPPLDRANSIAELQWGGITDFPATLERLRGKYYDRIYLNWDAYGPQLQAAMGDNYRDAGIIRRYEAPSRGPRRFLDFDFGLFEGLSFGYQGGLMGRIRVLDRKP
jgi:hypothetical protein